MCIHPARLMLLGDRLEALAYVAVDAPGIETLDIWIDAGDLDPWLERDAMLRQALADRGISHH